ncbi:chaperone protein dnaJ 20, chloroplastic-like [Musa acuminata AAA Group]|uniref:chaperone protein dnaJ 20, chloroplastic-like n=1 Tax=Musa acuminata AAA Group TaxID=214697 RepID=UPI0031D6071E
MLLLSSPVAKPALVAMSVRGRPRAPAATVRAAPGAATMYELLSVAETAGSEEIKAAYRRQARRWHPDACRIAGDEGYFAERFMRAREAYEVLSDQGLRREYDRALLRSDGGEWERQLEGLQWRRSTTVGRRGTSWGSRMRRAHGSEIFD